MFRLWRAAGEAAEGGQPSTSSAAQARLDAQAAGPEQPRGSSSGVTQTVDEILGIRDPMCAPRKCTTGRACVC